MKIKLVIFLVVVVAVLGIYSAEIFEERALAERESIKAQNLKELEYIQNLQMQADTILMADSEVNDFLNEGDCLELMEIIHNESFVEKIYITDFNSENKYTPLPAIMAEGKIYAFFINVSNESVTIVESADHNYLAQSTGLLSIKEEVLMENENLAINSFASINGFVGPWLPASGHWLYSFEIEGRDTIKSKSGLFSQAEVINYYLEVKEISDDNFYFSYDPTKNNFNTSSDSKECVPMYYENERGRDIQSARILCPLRNDLSLDYSYQWDIRAAPNQTIVFDVDIISAGFEDLSTDKKLHGWRILFNAPLPLDELDEDDWRTYKWWPPKSENSCYVTSVVIVKKGDWLENYKAEGN